LALIKLKTILLSYLARGDHDMNLPLTVISAILSDIRAGFEPLDDRGTESDPLTN
jgi:hypothetical protein